jgi:hypothetical protein
MKKIVLITCILYALTQSGLICSKNSRKVTNNYYHNKKLIKVEKRKQSNNKDTQLENFIPYIQKIQFQFQKEALMIASLMQEDEKLHLSDGYKDEPNFNLVISKNGEIKKLSLIKSSGSLNYDNYIIKSFKNAAPYEPIPNYIKSNEYQVSIIIKKNT